MKSRGWLSVGSLAFIVSGAGLLTAAETAVHGSEPALESKFAPYDTNRVHYRIGGAGEQALVFVHGWSCNVNVWREQVGAFAKDAKLILIDLPGHGLSDKPSRAYSMDFFAGAVLAVMEDAKISTATLLGHSMGAPVICTVYNKAPQKVAALVAVDGMLRRPPIKPEAAERFIAPYRTSDYREHASRSITSMFPIPGSEKLRDSVLDEMLKTPQHVMLAAMEGMFGDPGQPAWDLPKGDIPILSLNASNRMWTAEYETYVRGLSPKSDYRVLEGVGHFLMLEKPAEFNAALAEMLGKFRLIKRRLEQ